MPAAADGGDAPAEAKGGAEPAALAALCAALAADPTRFDFFQALRRFECLNPASPRIGRAARPSAEPVRLGQDPSLVFAPSTLASFTARGARPPRLGSYFFGLFGPQGALPSHLTAYAYERSRHHRDRTLASFLDLFHHRMLSAFYRAWTLSRPHLSADRPDPRQDWFSRYLASLFGLGMLSLRNRDAMPDQAKLFYAGLLSGQSKHPAGLRAMLADFFRLPVTVREFVGEWIRLPPTIRCRLGTTPDTGTVRLRGTTAILGGCVWSAQHRFRLVFGPLSFADFQRFLPGGASLARVIAFVRTYAGDQFAWDLNLVLRREDVPALRLDGRARLGWTTWLPAAAFSHDPADLVLRPLREDR